jgi:hypothetical protein
MPQGRGQRPAPPPLIFDDEVDRARAAREAEERRVAEAQAARERRKAELRAAMPITAQWVDLVRSHFGEDCRVNWAIENGMTVGPVPEEALRRHGLWKGDDEAKGDEHDQAASGHPGGGD